ncbi:MAG: NAD(P)/FAD-dependent oxidoreductase [Acidimicrobiia bacterium]
MSQRILDVLIVGGGPAGLSAALLLARCRRRVLVCDAGHPRNKTSQALHGFLTQDGINPGELLALGREQLHAYGVEFCSSLVTNACRVPEGFEVMTHHGVRFTSKKLLLATGIVDHLPSIEGLEALYGRSVFHCPYCDAWEVRDRALAVRGQGKKGAELALSLKTWSDNVVLCTDGVDRMPASERERLARHDIETIGTPIARLEGIDGRLTHIVFESGERMARDALFLSSLQSYRSDLPEQMGCSFTKRGAVRTGKFEETNVPGLYVAGDASRDMQFAIVAAAEGAKAAVAINMALQHEERN